MSRPSLLFFALALLCALSAASAQHLRTSADWAAFDYDADNVYLEVYYSFLQSDLNFEPTDGTLRGLTLGQLALLKDQEIIVSKAWKSETTISDSMELDQAKDIIDRLGMVAPVGDYVCRLIIQDLLKSENVDTLSWSVSLSASQAGVPHLSDIQLASSIRRAAADEKTSPFFKNSLIIEPNPALLYSFEHPALFFYTEAYNLPADQMPNGYRVKYYVVDSDGVIPEGINPKAVKKKKALASSVEFGMLNVGTLKTGAYTFKVEVQNDQLATIIEKSKKFYVLQKEDLTQQKTAFQSTPYESSVFVTMDSSAIEKEYLMIFYLLNKEEQGIHKEVVGLEQRRHFLYNFWMNKYPDVNVNENPMRAEYYRRARAADERYAAFKLDGWLTDRGRVSMVYGEPDDIERHPNEANMYQYEVWFYNSLQNGVKFVFADFESHGNYRLIHSDLLGEIQDANYRQTLMKAGGF